jgi:hypothetical protein
LIEYLGTTVASSLVVFIGNQEDESVNKLLLIMGVMAVLSVTACSSTNESASANSNTAVMQTQTPATRPGADNSEITTATDVSGTKTETRVFRDNKRVSRVVVTTRNGTRTVRAYSTKGEEKDLKDETVDALEATGEKVADAAGFVGDKGEDIAGETKDAAGQVKDKAKEVGETVKEKSVTAGEKTADGARTVADKTVEGAKTVGSKTKEGVKKAGSAVKKIIP